MTALELILHLAEGSTTPNTLKHIAKIARQTIEGLDSLKAQHDIADIIAGELKVSRGTAYELMREALAEAQPQQEPVIAQDGDTLEIETVLYTSPPQRQPLTDEEVIGLGNTVGLKAKLTSTGIIIHPDGIKNFARAIEAKIKEKKQEGTHDQ